MVIELLVEDGEECTFTSADNSTDVGEDGVSTGTLIYTFQVLESFSLANCSSDIPLAMTEEYTPRLHILVHLEAFL